MNENEWWSRYRSALSTFPDVANDKRAQFDILRVAGYLKPRSGLPRPPAPTPEQAARSALRLRYELPEHARKIVRETFPAPWLDAKAASSTPLPDPWWVEGPEADFWFEVERHFLDLQVGPRDLNAHLVRSDTGRRMLTGLRRVVGGDCLDDPAALARVASQR